MRRAIGAAVVARLQREGARVAVWDADATALARAPADHRQTLDLADPDAVQSATDATIAALGGLDILVASAGITGPNATTWEYPTDAWRRVMDLNVNAVFYCNRAVVPHMMARNYGRIVNIASIAGKEGNPNASAYSTSKAAVIAAHQVARQGAGQDRHPGELP